MSTRTVIEINHDYWDDLKKDSFAIDKILHLIQAGRTELDRDYGRYHVPGVRILGQRHHSETLKLTVE